MAEGLTKASSYVLPLLFLFVGGCFCRGGSRVTDAFFRGVREGLQTVLSLFPTLLLLLCGITLMRESGLLTWICELLSPLCTFLHIPSSLLPLILIRPLSGSASTAVLTDVFRTEGVDSFIGYAAAVLAGSSETLLYVISVYCTPVGVRRTRHVLPAALLTSVFVTVLSLIAAKVFY